MKTIVLSMAIVVGFFSQTLLACSCVAPADIATGVPTALKHTDVVFLGRVVGIQEDRVNEFETYETTEFAVKSVWKGEIGKTITTRILTTCCLCGFQFISGRDYLVYANRLKSGHYTTSTCSRTKNSRNADAELKFLDRFSKGRQ